MDDSVDLEFRKLALKEDDLNDTAMDICDILQSNSKRSKVATADKTARKTFKIMDNSGQRRSSHSGDESSFEIAPLSNMPTDRGQQNLDELQNEIEDLDNEVNQILRQLQDGSEKSDIQFEEIYGEEIESGEDKNESQEMRRLEKWNL